METNSPLRSRSTLHLCQIVGVMKRLASGQDGSQLLEVALVLPFLAVVVVGILDFGQAYNLKQKLNNAAREGARFAAGQNSGINLSTSDVTAVRDAVNNYLTNAGVTQCSIASSPTVSGYVYTFNSSSGGCGSFSLVIDRNYLITVGTVTSAGTHVTLTYPYTWSLGNVIKLLLPGSTLSLPATLSTDAIMQNLN
jgi:Flp pilus assembly protein TadG